MVMFGWVKTPDGWVFTSTTATSVTAKVVDRLSPAAAWVELLDGDWDDE